MKLSIVAFACFMTSQVFAQSRQQIKDANTIRVVIKSAVALSANDLSCKNHADCTVLELGSRACGGPSSYLVSSLKNRNFDSIETLASKSVQLEEEYNVKYNVFSICTVAYRPVASCVLNRCIDTNPAM